MIRNSIKNLFFISRFLKIILLKITKPKTTIKKAGLISGRIEIMIESNTTLSLSKSRNRSTLIRKILRVSVSINWESDINKGLNKYSNIKITANILLVRFSIILYIKKAEMIWRKFCT